MDSMITPEQIRAARALLDWPTSELAKRTALTVNGLNKIERGHVNAQRETLEKIQRVFEDSGLEFLPGSGLRRKDKLVSSYEGKDAWKVTFDDFVATLGKHDVFRMAFLDEGELHEKLCVDQDYLLKNLKTRQNKKVFHKVLVPENRYVYFPSYDTYHVVPEAYHSPYPLFIYKNKLSLLSWQFAPKVIFIEDERFADAAAKLFDFIFDHTKTVAAEWCLDPKELKKRVAK